VVTVLAALLPALLTGQSSRPAKKAPAAQKTKTPPPAPPVGLTVEGILSMVQGGLSEDLIMAKIRTEGRAFDLAPE